MPWTLALINTTAIVLLVVFPVRVETQVALSTTVPSQSVASSRLANELGNHLSSTWGKFYPYPLTAIEARGAKPNFNAFASGGVGGVGTFLPYNSTCDPNVGIAHTANGAAPTGQSPVTLYYTSGGLIAGFGVTVYGPQIANLVELGYWRKQAPNQHFISISFRAPSMMCSGETNSQVLGDRVVINQGQGKGSLAIPLTWAIASRSGRWYIYGSSFTGMGMHSAYNLDPDYTPGELPMNSTWMLPVVAMYDVLPDGRRGGLVSIFLASTSAQDSTVDPALPDPSSLAGKFFDGPPGGFPPAGFCNNWCAGSGLFSPGLTLLNPNQQKCDKVFEGFNHDTFHWQFYPADTIRSPPTADRVCGGTLPFSMASASSGAAGASRTVSTTTIVGSDVGQARCCYPKSTPAWPGVNRARLV